MERFSLDPGRFTWNSLDGHWIGVNDSTFARAPEADEMETIATVNSR
jgi:hypothetical protein